MAVMPNKTAKEIINVPLEEEVTRSYLEYSMSVVYSRAVPDINGFKPSQTRLLYSMFEEGFTPDKSFVKSAKPVSSTMGNYHPHGDSSLYGALVKLAQPFYLNVPLVEGYGNFGDVTGSPPAASRYTECKLAPEAMYLLEELREDTVDFKDNYSGDRKEPVILPCQFPNLVVNGNFGIAVGFASNLAPHNMTEALDAALLVLKKPNVSTEELMKILPGPDFPTGATIIGLDEIQKAFETGKGVIKLRSKYEIKPTTRGKNEIIFTELPYGVKTETILDKIKEGLKTGKFAGLADAKDLTDRKNGLRFVVETKAGSNPAALAAELFRLTPLEESFGINNTVLVDGEPRVVSMKEMLDHFIKHRVEVVTRRTKNRLEKRTQRLHMLDALLKALANIDAVIKIIRGSDSPALAQTALMTKLKIDEPQADYILGLALRRLTRLEQLELEKEKEKLTAEVNELQKILDDESVLKRVIGTELTAVKKALGRPRRSVISGANISDHIEETKAAANASLEVEDTPCTIGVYNSGSLTRSSDAPNVSGRGRIDPLVTTVVTTARSALLAITNTGRAVRFDAVNITENSKVTPANAGITLKKGEKVLAVVPNAPADGKGVLALGTRKGIIKTVKPDWTTVRADEFEVIGLTEGDEIIAGRWFDDPNDAQFFFMTNENLLRFDGSKVRAQGRTGGGMAGISVPEGASVLHFAALTNAEVATGEFYVVIGDDKKKIVAMKRSLLDDIPVKGRATGGVRHSRLLRGQAGVLDGFITTGDNMILDKTGKMVTRPEIAKRDGSGTLIEVDGLVFGRTK